MLNDPYKVTHESSIAMSRNTHLKQTIQQKDLPNYVNENVHALDGDHDARAHVSASHLKE